MGNLHNLFGRVNEAHVFLDEDEESGYYLEETIADTTMEKPLTLVQYTGNDLARRIKSPFDRAIRESRLRPKGALWFGLKSTHYKKKREKTLRERLEISSNILDLSYKLISHYDSKTNQLLTIIGIDFAVIGFILNGFFSNIEKLNDTIRWSVIIFCIINFALLIISLLFVRLALVPHVHTVVKHVKPKYGLCYFKDIVTNLGEEEYVKILLGKNEPTESKYYSKNETDAFEKCIVEDNARDIFAHAEILNIKTKYVHMAFNTVVASTIFLLVSMLALSIVFMYSSKVVTP